MKHLLLSCLMVLCALTTTLAQTSPKTYTYLIFHKLAPGMTIQDALPVEREWKVINQAAVDEGNLIGWHMMVKQMSSNPNPTEYDYVTCIVSNEMAIKGASAAAMTKIYGDSVQTRMASLQKRDRQTAPVVKMEIWENLDTQFGPAFGPGKTGIVVVDFMRLRDSSIDWTKAMGLMKQAATAQVGQNQLGGWGFSALLLPNGSEKGYGFAVARPMTNTKVMSTLADSKGTDAQKQINKTFDVVRQEVFRFEQYTTRPNAAK